jgi:DUF971 family protein
VIGTENKMQPITGHWPTEIRLTGGGRQLVVTFDDERSFTLAAEYLRVSSPSAEVRGHTPAQRTIVAGKINVAIADVVPTGNYAVRLIFDDRHETGIFTWNYLYELGELQPEKWAEYLAELAAHGLQRQA